MSRHQKHFDRDWPTIERSAEHLPVLAFVDKVMNRGIHTLVSGLTTQQATLVSNLINDIARNAAQEAYTNGVRRGIVQAIEEYTRTRQEQL